MPEPLEPRIAPATLVNAHVVKYTDIDGDHVTIHSSASLFTTANVNNLLTFSTGSVDGASTPQQLQLINLTAVNVPGDNISVTVQQAGSGDGLANVGFIRSGLALGHVLVQGDLGGINCGAVGTGGSHYVGLASLTVHSLGAQGISTQAAGGNLTSQVFGAIGSITVQQDMVNAEIQVESNTAGIAVNGNIGSLRIGGNLTGGTAILSGSISLPGNIGSVVIGGDMQGGSGQNSSSFQVGGRIGSLSVDDIVGYTHAGDSSPLGAGSASVITGTNFIVGGIGSLTIKGNLLGGEAQGAGFLGESTPGGSPSFISGSFGTVKIGGAITGGSGANSAELNANAFGAISIGKGITGGSGASSGLISSVNGIKSLTISQGGIIGGTAVDAGSVMAATAPTGSASIGAIVIHGNITGNSAAGDTVDGTGQINTNSSISSVTLYGSLLGSTAPVSGSILATDSIGHITLRAGGGSAGSILGGTAANSGEISAFSIGSVSIAGQIEGNSTISGSDTGANSGKIITASNVGGITIGKGIAGGLGAGSGALDIGSGFGAKLTSLSITSGGISGNSGAGSGVVNVGGAIGSVKLNGSAITAGTGPSSGALIASDNAGSLSIGSLIIGSGAGAGAGQISVGGNLTSLTFTGAPSSSTADSGLVSVSGSAGAISVHGDVIGTGDSTGEFLIGGALKSISITGSLRGGSGVMGVDTGADSGSIFAGLDDAGAIGSVKIGSAITGGSAIVTGGVVGGAGDASGRIFGGGGIGKAAIGYLNGGGGTSSGSLASDGPIGSVTVKDTAAVINIQGIIGGSGDGSGQISAGTTIQSVTLTGPGASLIGGSGVGSGSIVSHTLLTSSGDIQGDIGSISIGGGIAGASGVDSGQVSAAGNLKTISVKDGVVGAAASGTGAILAGVDLAASTGGDITTLKIGGALWGADVPNGASPVTVNGSGYIQAGHIGSASIGSIQAGVIGSQNTVTNDAAILAANDIASITVGGILGTSTDSVLISAVGQVNPGKTDLAFGKISVGSGGVTYTNFLAGYDQSQSPVNGAASIGTVIDAGSWSGSNLVAGVLAGQATGHFGDPSATLIATTPNVIPTIASIIIKGHVTSAPVAASPDTYGFVAKDIKSFSVNGQPQSLALGVITNVDQSTDTDLRDVAVFSYSLFALKKASFYP